MSVGDLTDNGNKGKNFPWQLAVLQLLDAIATGSSSAGLALESTLQQVLAAIQSGVDFEAKLVVDNNNVTWLEVRTWNQGSGSFNPPVYYMAGSNTPGSPALPITYINPQTLLAQIASNTTGLNLEVTQLLVKAVLDAIKIDTANLDVALSTRASEATLVALLAAFNAEDFATETTLAAILAILNNLTFTGGDLNVSANIQVGDTDVSGANPVPISFPTGAQSSHYIRVVGVAPTVIAAGATEVSIMNTGADNITVDTGLGPEILEPGIRLSWRARTGRTLGIYNVVGSSAGSKYVYTAVI